MKQTFLTEEDIINGAYKLWTVGKNKPKLWMAEQSRADGGRDILRSLLLGSPFGAICFILLEKIFGDIYFLSTVEAALIIFGTLVLTFLTGVIILNKIYSTRESKARIKYGNDLEWQKKYLEKIIADYKMLKQKLPEKTLHIQLAADKEIAELNEKLNELTLLKNLAEDEIKRRDRGFPVDTMIG